MSRPTYFAALTRFDKERDPNNHVWYPRLPDNPGTAHSYRPMRFESTPRQNHFLDSPIEYRKALCGATIKVILATGFRLDDDDACQSCVALTHQETETGVAAQGAPPLRPRSS
jgi:hypothetical protein